MATFPDREADIARLAHDLATGLATHPDDFPAPPVGADEIQQSLAEYNTAREAAIQASNDVNGAMSAVTATADPSTSMTS